jgi:Trp operon repressor
MNPSPPLRQPCPPGACICERERLQALPQADLRILLLTRQEEKRLLERLENLDSLADLERLQQRMFEQLGLRVHVGPGANEVRTMRGIRIELDELPGMCRKTRQAIPAAIRRALEKRPEIAFTLLNAHDLLRDA